MGPLSQYDLSKLPYIICTRPQKNFLCSRVVENKMNDRYFEEFTDYRVNFTGESSPVITKGKCYYVNQNLFLQKSKIWHSRISDFQNQVRRLYFAKLKKLYYVYI